MPNDASRLISLALGFLLVGARVTGAFYFVPFPGVEQANRLVKALLIFSITASLFPFWPALDPNQPVMGLIVTGMFKEAGVGLCLGLVISLAVECFSFCFHLVGLQAGYTYASTIDPTSTADVTVLESLGHLAAGLLFFSTGLHRSVIQAFAASLQAHPAGTWNLGPNVIEPVIRLFQVMLSTGLRLALPVLASMTMIDLALALIGRVSSHLQLIFLAFPVKMLASLLMIGWILIVLPSIFDELSLRVLSEVRRLIGA
jgi:flagellar biosynthetic protein FliR